MKRILAILLALSFLISLIACAESENTEEPVVSSTIVSQIPSAEDALKDVNELEPVNGVYQIKSVVGLENIAKHPDADFVLLCDIDLQGAEWIPVGTQEEPFTGNLDGAYFTVSNFAISNPDKDGNQGLFGVNNGMVKNLLLSGVNITTNAQTINVGAFAGINNGTVLRCTANGTLTAQQAGNGLHCGGGVGLNTGKISSGEFDVDMLCDTEGSAAIGTLTGCMTGGTLEYSSGLGLIKVTGGKSTVGLLCGEANKAVIKGVMFLGESNTVDDELFTDFVGSAVASEITNCRYRDNSAEKLPENILSLRHQVVDKMYEMATVEWTVSQQLYHSCSCSLAVCHGVWLPGVECRGMPYTHKGGSLDRFKYCLDENGVVKDWVYELDSFDGFDMYMGNDCSTAIQMAYASIGNSFNFLRCTYQLPYYNRGCIAVGDWEWEMAPVDSRTYTKPYLDATGEERMYESYAQLRMGDSVVFIDAEGGHTRMACEDAVVVRDENGAIDPDNSYVLVHQQGGVSPQVEPYYTSWGLFNRYTFSALWLEGSLPVTIQELIDGVTEQPQATLEDGIDGIAGLTTGVVVSNYYLDSVSMKITAQDDSVVFDHRMFTTVGKTTDANSNDTLIRCMIMDYDLAHFTTALREIYFYPENEYHCVITAHLGTGDEIVVKDYTF